MISIIIPLYNKEMYIENTLNKVLSQTFLDFEILIINDGSTDTGPDIVKRFSDSRIKLITKENGGVSSARNLGIEHAKFEYLAFLDADDEWRPRHLEEICDLIKHYSEVADVFVTNFARKYSDGEIVNNRSDSNLKKGVIENYFELVIKKSLIHTSCVCVSKKALSDVGSFDERISRGEDIDLWIRLARQYKIAYSPVVTELYLQEAINNSNKKSDVSRSIVYYLDFNTCIDKNDRKMYTRMKYKKYLSLLLRERDFQGFMKLFNKLGF